MATPSAQADQPSSGTFRGATRFQIVLVLAIVLGLAIAVSLISAQFFVPPGQPLPGA
jgi:hypothetical protein